MKRPHWPDRWDERKGTIYYRPRSSEREKFSGQYYFRLGRTEAEAFATWYRLIERTPVPRTIREAIGMYKATDRFAKLSANTQRDYVRTLNNIEAVFGDVAPDHVLAPDVGRYLDTRPPVTANRERSVFSTVMRLCVRRGATNHNVIGDLERNAEQPRDRYVDDVELDRFYQGYCTYELRARIDVLILTGARAGQIRQLTRFDWDGEGLKVPRAKGGRAVRYRGPNLQRVIEEMLEVRKGRRKNSEFLFPNRNGDMYTADGWRTIWQRAMAKYVADGFERFQERDIRAKVASDSDSLLDANERLGHQSTTTTKRVYMRGTQNVTELQRGRLREE